MDPKFILAKQDFLRARRKALVRDLLSRLSNNETDLLAFEEVRKKLHITESAVVIKKEIPLEAVVGSVGRYQDFSRDFLPRTLSDQERWARVKITMEGQKGVPPVDVYQVGDAYFVLDGNHRISIARENGYSHIDARVRQVNTKVNLPADVRAEDMIALAEYAGFLEETRLTNEFPDADLRMTEPGQFDFLLQQIEIQQFQLFLENEAPDVSYSDAVRTWYQTIYLPLAELIRDQDLLADFPDRTEADLFVWLMKHRGMLIHDLGFDVSAEQAVEAFRSVFDKDRGAEMSELVVDTAIVERLRTQRPVGGWRESRQQRQEGRLFNRIGVFLDSSPEGQAALELALGVASFEGADVQGVLYQHGRKQGWEEELGERFRAAVEGESIAGQLSKEPMAFSEAVLKWTPWLDLLVLPVLPGFISRSGMRLTRRFRKLLRKIPTPVLLVPAEAEMPGKVLLAYNGSEKANEALFLAAYMSSLWGVELAVSPDKGLDAELKEYLDRYYLEAELVPRNGETATALLQAADETSAGWTVMGGYGRDRLLGGMRRKTIDRIVVEGRSAVLLCK